MIQKSLFTQVGPMMSVQHYFFAVWLVLLLHIEVFGATGKCTKHWQYIYFGQAYAQAQVLLLVALLCNANM